MGLFFRSDANPKALLTYDSHGNFGEHGLSNALDSDPGFARAQAASKILKEKYSRCARVNCRALLTYGEALKIFALRTDRTQARSVDSTSLVTLAFLGASA